MKQIIASLMLVTWLAGPAAAKGKNTKHTSRTKGCPSATCTDHSYDMAYTAPNQPKHNCPSATCTDHSYDEAYSAGKMPQSSTVYKAARRSASPYMVDRYYGPPRVNDRSSVTRENTNSYSLSNYTFYGRTVTGVARPSAYEGDDAPTYDGAAVNAYRNMRYLNTSERLPSNSGQ